MKVLTTTGLTELITKIKATFIKTSDTITATTIDIDTTPTANSTNLVASGGVKAAIDESVATKISDAPSDSKTYGRNNGAWVEVTSGASSWSDITNKPFNSIDNVTLKVENNVLKVFTTDNAEADNTKPITSSGVHTLVGNINSLLELI